MRAAPEPYAKGAWFGELWALPGVEVMSSPYAAREAERNLDSDEQGTRLAGFLKTTVLVSPSSDTATRTALLAPRLPAKDLPILAAAIQAGAARLLTGDDRHFGEHHGKTLGGVKVMSPFEFIRAYRRRRP